MSRRFLGLLTAALLVVAGSAVATARPAATPKVVGGTPAPAAWTFVAALIRPGDGSIPSRHFCGGALIAPTWVVTAAHCAKELQGTTGGLVVLGRADLAGTGGDERSIKSITRNPTWTGTGGSSGDIALIELDRASGQAPAVAMTSDAEPAWDGLPRGSIAGWGYTVATGGRPSPVLLSAQLPIFPDGQCERFLPNYDGTHLLCAGNTQASACNGDSGGPLVATDTKGRLAVAGVSSFGPPVCGRSPSFYARLSGYADWLAATMGPVTTTPPTTPPVTAPPGVRQAYSILSVDGTVHSFGAAGYGAAGACKAPRSCVDVAGPAGSGYWVSRGSCEISAFGPVTVLRSPATEERCTLAAQSGKGLWALTPSGRVFNLGSAANYGQGRNRPKLAWQQIEARPQGDGYWLLGSDGAVAGFGGAKVLTSSGGQRLTQPVVDMASTPKGTGYWLVARDGSVSTFGDARFLGSTGGRKLGGPIIGLQPTSTGGGYWLFGADGAVFGFGDAKVVGSAVGKPGPMVAAVRR
ncbi:MAG: Esterase [Actinomycetia bacterium]|nr:Esterase [Actinomycetes bacterium]